MPSKDQKRLGVIQKNRKTLMDHMGRCKTCDPVGNRCEKGQALQAEYRRSKHGPVPPIFLSRV